MVVQLPNIAEFVLVWFGLQRLGAVPVHAMPGHRRSEIGHLVHGSGAVAYIVPDRYARFDHRELAAEFHGVPGNRDGLRHVVVVGDPGPHKEFVAFADLLAEPAAPGQLSDGGAVAGDLALLSLSGGTTGLPKLVPRTHDDYAYNAVAAAQAAGLAENSVYLAVLPVGFNFTFACPGVLGTLCCGGAVVLAPDPSPQTAFPLIEREQVTITPLSPPLVPHWLNEYRTYRAALDTLQVLQVGGARLADELARRAGPALATRAALGGAAGMAVPTSAGSLSARISSVREWPRAERHDRRTISPHLRNPARAAIFHGPAHGFSVGTGATNQSSRSRSHQVPRLSSQALTARR